jgi:hypothetical protein
VHGRRVLHMQVSMCDAESGTGYAVRKYVAEARRRCLGPVWWVGGGWMGKVVVWDAGFGR